MIDCFQWFQRHSMPGGTEAERTAWINVSVPLSDPHTFSLRVPFFFPITQLTPTFLFSFKSNPKLLPCFLATPNKLLAITSLANSQYAILSYK